MPIATFCRSCETRYDPSTNMSQPFPGPTPSGMVVSFQILPKHSIAVTNGLLLGN